MHTIELSESQLKAILDVLEVELLNEITSSEFQEAVAILIDSESGF